MSSSPYLNVSSSRYVVSWSFPEISDLGLGVCCEGCACGCLIGLGN